MNKELFTEFDPFALKAFDRLYPLLAELIPMKPSQKKELPYACKELSEYLTTDREFLSRPYWTSPRLLSAYFHYFMVWNLIRLCKLFPNLDLGTIPQKAVFMDLGSGPLTIPLALWISREDLRRKDIAFICADLAPQPLHLGKSLFEKLRQELMPECTWKIQTLRTPNHKAFRQIHEPVDFLTMGNVLNEGDEKKKISAYEQIRQLYENANQALAENGKIFAVEPGTRQGARMIQILRNLCVNETEEADEEFDEDFSDAAPHDYEDDFADDFYADEAPCKIISPCPLDIKCPLAKAHKQNAWCHFNAKADCIPKELRELSQKAGLDKDSVSLSYLYLAKSREADKILARHNTAEKARIISDAFPVPKYKGRARYACHEKGLLLILDSAAAPAGTLCEVSFPQKAERDFKSKALLCTLKNKNSKTLKELEIKESVPEKSFPDKKAKKQSAQKTAKTAAYSGQDRPPRSPNNQRVRQTKKKNCAESKHGQTF